MNVFAPAKVSPCKIPYICVNMVALPTGTVLCSFLGTLRIKYVQSLVNGTSFLQQQQQQQKGKNKPSNIINFQNVTRATQSEIKVRGGKGHNKKKLKGENAINYKNVSSLYLIQ